MPRYSIRDEMARNLMLIQKAAATVEFLPLPSSTLKELQRQSRETTVILSTKLEGNDLDERAKRAALYAKKPSAQAQEVFNLMRSAELLDDWAERQLPITEEFIKKLHAVIRVIPYGRRPHLSQYRTQQNQVGNRNQPGYYLPPEAKDVPKLIEDLVAWINAPATLTIPAPLQAGIFMYQFLTIHPYMDGNGRTARMLATYILRRAGLGLKGLFSLESYYDRNLRGYYANLQMGLSHNYYKGRNDPDLTPWLEFFVTGLAEVFQEAAGLVQAESLQYMAIEPEPLRHLDPHQRMVFAQLAFRREWMTTTDLRSLLGLSDRTIRDRVKQWIQQGFLAPRDEHSERVRSVTLSPQYQDLVRAVREEPDRYRYLLR
ncbi:MAG: Fic family protein [Bacillota bacterium]